MTGIHFKNHLDEPKWEFLDFRVKWLAELAQAWFSNHNHPVLLVTDVDTEGVHMPGSPHYDRRAIDLRLPNSLDTAEEFATWVNSTFSYGGGKVCVLTGKFDPTNHHNDHIHLQVPKPYRRWGSVLMQGEA